MANDTSARTLADRFWGRVADLDINERVTALVFVMTCIVFLSFCQLGFWPIGVIDGKPVYLMLIMAPLIMGAFLFGPLTGALLGLFTGIVLFAHASAFPLDFYEVYFMTSLNTFVLMTALGALSGWLFSVVYHRCHEDRWRAILTFLACIALSFATSGLTAMNTVIMYGGVSNIALIGEYILPSFPGLLLQAAIDAVLVVVLCLISDVIVRKLKTRAGNQSLLSIFRNWMIFVSAIVLMVVSPIIFSVATAQAQDAAHEGMLSEVRYLQNQIGFKQNTDYRKLLEGYDVALDGYTAIVNDEGVVLASNTEERFPEGSSILDALGMAPEEGETVQEIIVSTLADNAENESIAVVQAMESGVRTMDFEHIATGVFDGGYVVITRTPDLIYASRSSTMFASILLALALVASISALATALLKQVIVHRIDETNESLVKITDGNLNERVDVHDSREFTSLSNGINTTVSALKGTIDEVKQRNAQELLTAKAIQENSLPTDFPAFPEIDTFDIYASMKTAKEVGGDFYDFFLIEDTTKVGFIMADVSGKGIPAALFMMTAKTQLRNYLEAGLPVSEAVEAANHQLCIGNETGMFVTTWVGELNYETGELSYVNAGHNPPLILHEGTWEWMREVSGMPLGLFDGMPYEPHALVLQPEDMMYLYTDGVTEAMDIDGNLLGEERLIKTLHKYSTFNPRSVCVGVRRAITDFTHDCEQSDDITMLGLKYGVPPETHAVMVLNANDDQLVHVCNYIHAELHRRHAPKWVYNPLDIAAEELFVNVCHYAYPDATPENPGEVRISFEYEPNPPSLTVQIADDGVAYNPLEKPDAVTPDDIEDAPIGGLGIFMAKRSVDNMTYERVGESNVLTFSKAW